MFGAIISVAVLAFILIALIRGKYKDKTPKWIALLVFILPTIEWILVMIDEKTGFFFVLCCFFSIPIFLIFTRIKAFQEYKSLRQNTQSSKPNLLFNLIEQETSSVKLTNFSHPAISVFMRLYIVIAILLNVKLVGNDELFHDELRFQILSLIVLFFLSLFIFFNRLDISKLKTLAESKGKIFPFKFEEFGKFKTIINSVITVVLLLILLVADAHITVQKLLNSPQFLGLNIFLLLHFIAGIFLILSNPLNALKIFFLRGIELYRNYVYAIFIGIAIVLPLSLFWKGEFPFLMLGFNVILLYNEIMIYKYFLNNK